MSAPETHTPTPVVKPLEWHKSHMTGWNDDWHTTAPFVYLIRCADENGWKWSAQGAFGYEATPTAAKAMAQAHYERRILSALSVDVASLTARVDELEAENARLREAIYWYGNLVSVAATATQSGEAAYDYLMMDAGEVAHATLSQTGNRDSEQLNGSRPLPFDRDELGRRVREAWVRWAETQPVPKPSWLVPYAELSEADKEADRQIGEAIARWTLIGDAARAALNQGGGTNG